MPDWRSAGLGTAAVLLACSPPTEEETAPSSDTQTASPRADSAQHAEPAAALPSSDAEYRYIGRWAESIEQCRGEAWTLTRDRLTAPDGNSCAFGDVEQSPGGYAIDATCTIDGKTEDENITLRFAESAKAMLVEGAASLPETGLIYCGKVS